MAYLAGDDLPAADFAWQSWTPTFTNLTVGTGGIAGVVARYCHLGNLVFIRMRVALGSSGFSVGSNPAFTPPVTPAANYTAFQRLLEGRIVDASTGAGRQAQVAYISATELRFAYWNATPDLAAISSTAPWTWAASDLFEASGVYETTV